MKNTREAIKVTNLSVYYQKNPILYDISVSIASNMLLGIIGPNGAGKSTFLKTILNVIKPRTGSIEILGSSYKKNYSKLSYIPQRATVDWDFPISVFDVVLMGRYPHIGWFKRPSTFDVDCAWQALKQVDLVHYADRPIGQLSGGQQQRIFLARALAQQAEIYLLDEPFIGIDALTEKIIIKILKKLRNNGKTVIVVHHDLQTLVDYFDWLLLLNKKRIAYGPTETVLMPEYMCATYGQRNVYVPKVDI